MFPPLPLFPPLPPLPPGPPFPAPEPEQLASRPALPPWPLPPEPPAPPSATMFRPWMFCCSASKTIVGPLAPGLPCSPVPPARSSPWRPRPKIVASLPTTASLARMTKSGMSSEISMRLPSPIVNRSTSMAEFPAGTWLIAPGGTVYSASTIAPDCAVAITGDIARTHPAAQTQILSARILHTPRRLPRNSRARLSRTIRGFRESVKRCWV